MNPKSHLPDAGHFDEQAGDLKLKQETDRLASDLVRKCHVLLEELEQFQQFLATKKNAQRVELRHYKTSIKTELRSLQRALDSPALVASRTAHTLRSSNFPFYSAVWNTAKSCKGVIAFQKRFYWDISNLACSAQASKSEAHHRHCSAVVDIVARDGLEWIKVSTVNEKRILFDKAKAGWIESWSSDESNDDEDGKHMDDNDEPEGLLKQAEALLKAAKAERIRYKHPTVHIVLPRIARHNSSEVDALIKEIQDLGVLVSTADAIPSEIEFCKAVSNLAVDPFALFSDTINVDCTILLALISDLSHGQVDKEDWHHRAVLRQIEMEIEDQLVPSSLWPACGSRRMICTHEAAQRMQEIVDLIGTAAEKERAQYLLNFGHQTNISPSERVEAFQKMSEYRVPREWMIPIEVITVDVPEILRQLPPIAQKVAENISDINQSVFLYGWFANLTTISSNRTVAKEIESSIEANRTDENQSGPHIWLCPTARSLVGKEKTRRGQKP